MKGLFTIGAATAVAGCIGYVYREKLVECKDRFYDKRFGGLHLKKEVCRSLRESVTCEDRRPVMGLDYPLESNLLVLVEEGTNKLIMSLGKNKSGKVEWTLVGGKAESQKRYDEKFVDFADLRFVSDNQQLTANQCSDIIFENPKTSLAREVLEELTGSKDISEEQKRKFDWLVQKIYSSPDWTFVKTNKTVKVDETTKIEGFATYMGLCRVILSSREITMLNDEIEQYKDREHTFFVPKEWEVNEFESKGKSKNRLAVKVDDEHPVRKYNAEIMFVHYWREFNDLITKDQLLMKRIL
jgi:hypothetical protein